MLGDADKLAEALVIRLGQRGIGAERSRPETDAEASAVLNRSTWRAVVILTRDDILALRLSLLSAHLRPELPVWTTMFDTTVTRELRHSVPAVTVLSPASLVGDELARLCLGAGARPVGRLRRGVRLADDALRLLVGAGVGLVIALVVGFGQVGLRLAQNLRRRGVPVLAVERNPDAPCLRLARDAGIPVAIRRGEDRATLELLGIRRCAVVAAVTSDDLVNVEVGLAASDLAPGIPVVLRLGDGEVAAETDSLLHLGQVCDAHAIVADALIGELSAP